MAAIDVVNRVLREFRRYTGDGLPGEPVNAPLPVGDPQSGVHSPKKAELRTALLSTIDGGGEAAQAVIDANLPAILEARDDAEASASAAWDSAFAASASATQAGIDADRAEGYAALLGTATGRLSFKLVSGLLADTTMGYSGADIDVGLGDIIEAQGFRYEVVASGATDAHVETAGGVKLYVLPLDGAYSAVAFGAIVGQDALLSLTKLLAASVLRKAVIDGEFLVSNFLDIPSNSTIEIIEGCGLKLADGSGVGALMRAIDQENITIEGTGYLDANEAAQGGILVNSLYFQRGNNIHVKGIKSSGFGIGVRFIGTTNFSCNGTELTDGRIRGIEVDNDTSDLENVVIARDFVLAKNRIERVRTSATPGALVDGHGILIRGQEGYGNPGEGVLSWVKDFEIKDNTLRDNGRSGITIISGEDFEISGNRCVGHNINTNIGAGIIISVAARHFTLYGNRCDDNYDAGILIDTLAEQGIPSSNTINYGRASIFGNVCRDNVRAGIKVNCAPHLEIFGNICSGGIWGIFYWYYSRFSTIRDNQILDCTENGIRLAGAANELASQIKILLADNKILSCGTVATGSHAAIYIANYSDARLEGNEDQDCPVSLRSGGTVTGLRMTDNRFRGGLVLGASSQVSLWDGSGLDTCTAFNSSAFGGDGKDTIRVNADFVIPHFGLSFVRLTAIANVTGGSSGAIAPGRRGQELLLHNTSGFTITIPNHSTVSNIGGGSLVIVAGSTARYVYGGTSWRQVS